MSHEQDSAHGPEKPGFFRSYVWSTNHKVIGKQFLVTSLVFLFIAGTLALSLRWQLAHPDEPVPVIGKIIFATAEERAAAAKAAEAARPKADQILAEKPAEAKALATERLLRKNRKLTPPEAAREVDRIFSQDPARAKALVFEQVAGPTVTSLGRVKENQFISLTTIHGLMMIFFVVIPILVGAFGNFLIPLHVGTHDMAFPVLNAASYWVFWLSCLFAIGSFFAGGDPAGAGWTMYAPLSVIGMKGASMSMIVTAAILVGFSSIMGAVNYLTTILKMRAPGLSMWRLPLTTWAQFITAILQLLATPVLAGALVMLLCDRILGTSFFIPGGLSLDSQQGAHVPHSGGSVILWQHVFWFYSHPAVYILVLPAMGMASDLLAVGARKPIFGYKAMVFSIAGIAGLGFIVWAHHMFLSGMKPTLATAFMVSTMLIALPSSIKVFNWLGTLWRGSIRFDVPTLNAMSFVAMFIIGGLSGIFMAATPVDIFIHDTYFIVAHFHYVVFGGSLFAVFGAIFFWYPKMFGRMMNPALGKLHWFLTFVFFNLTFFPMHIIGAGGHMRRIASVDAYNWLTPFQGWNTFITHSAIALGISQLLFLFNFFWSMAKGPKAPGNPWEANTLEWTLPCPAPEHNYEKIPTVHHGPYEYGVRPDKDWLPQTEESAGAAH